MTINEREYQRLCIAILARAMKDYKNKPCDRRIITQFVNSNLCDLYCEMAGIDTDYFRALHEETKEVTASTLALESKNH